MNREIFALREYIVWLVLCYTVSLSPLHLLVNDVLPKLCRKTMALAGKQSLSKCYRGDIQFFLFRTTNQLVLVVEALQTELHQELSLRH